MHLAVPLVSGRCSDKQVGEPGTQASFAAVAVSLWCGKKGIATGNTQVSRVRGNRNGRQRRRRVGRHGLSRFPASSPRPAAQGPPPCPQWTSQGAFLCPSVGGGSVWNKRPWWVDAHVWTPLHPGTCTHVRFCACWHTHTLVPQYAEKASLNRQSAFWSKVCLACIIPCRNPTSTPHILFSSQ